MNYNFQMNRILYTQNCYNNQVNYQNLQNLQCPIFYQNQNIFNNSTVNSSQISPVNKQKAQSSLLMPKSTKSNFLSKPIEIPKQFNDKLIRKLMRDKRFSFNQFEAIKKTQSYYEKQLKRTRIPFTKEEDEKIIQLVNRFGSGHWELISHFMERRTAKQCRDRYTNYLVPGVFQGEWMKEEDELLTRLYNSIGPKWSILQKYIPYRSSTNIKNRWHYFLSKQNQNQLNAVNEGEVKSTIQNEELVISGNNSIVDVQTNDLVIHQENERKDDKNQESTEELRDFIAKYGNEILDPKNNIFDLDNEWMFGEYSLERKSIIDK